MNPARRKQAREKMESIAQEEMRIQEAMGNAEVGTMNQIQNGKFKSASGMNSTADSPISNIIKQYS
jgi:hypothetical protein